MHEDEINALLEQIQNTDDMKNIYGGLIALSEAMKAIDNISHSVLVLSDSMQAMADAANRAIDVMYPDSVEDIGQEL